MKIVSVAAAQRLLLGIQGEHLVQEIAFDFTEWQKQYGEGQIQLQIQRHGDEVPYPVLLRVEGNLAVWSIERRDTEKEGYGALQLLYIVGGEQVAKSHIFSTFVEKALSKPGPVQPEEQSFGDKVALDATRAEAAAKKAGQVADEVARLGQEVNVAAQQTAADAKQTAADRTASTMAKNQAIAAADAAAKDKAAAQAAAQQTKQHADAVNKTAVVVAQQAQETKGHAAIAQQAAQEVAAIINDAAIATDKTWSSQKIHQEIDAKADKDGIWEVIEETVSDGKPGSFRRTQEPVGTPYKFRKLRISLFNSNNPEQIWISGYVGAGGGASGEQQNVCYLVADFPQGTDKCIRFDVFPNSGTWEGVFRYNSIGSKEYYLDSRWSGERYDFSTKQLPYLVSIDMSIPPAGTKIVIKAVRA